MRFSLISKFLLITFVIALFSSCENKEHIRTYRLAKTQDTIQRKNANSEKQSNSKLTWEVSELWKEVSGHSMRLASFQVPCGDEFGDLSVTTLEGSSGSMFANVQRWMGQIGLENATEAEFNSLNKMKIGNLGQFNYFKLINPSNEQKAILVSIYRVKNSSVFIKLMSSISCIKENENEFLKFCESFALSN